MTFTTHHNRARRWPARVSGVAVLAVLIGVAPSQVGASPGQEVTPIGPDATAADLVDELVGGGVTTSNVTFTGDDESAGIFTGMDAIGFDSGIVLSSGMAADVVGPNEDTGWTTEFDTSGDADLDAIVAPNTTADASVLEFDFVPTTSDISFEYVFASEEYNEFVNSEFNDVFAFFVNGENCALIPETTEAVSINTVNGGNPFGTDASHPELYINNDTLDPGPATIDTEMDGLTTVLRCDAQVDADETNHMKLAIADTSDLELDTAVFLRALSFQSEVAPECPDQELTVESGDVLPVTLEATDENTDDTLTYEIVDAPQDGTLSGDAPEVDYTSDDGFAGTDSFTYTASDGTSTCEAGTVTITVTAPPAPPAAPVPAAPTFTG